MGMKITALAPLTRPRRDLHGALRVVEGEGGADPKRVRGDP